MLRRDFLKFSIQTALFLGCHVQTSHANTFENRIKTTIAIAGGGFAGLSAAKEIKRLNPDIEVLLIEQRTHFMSCPFSNLWLGNVQNITLKQLMFDYNQAITQFGYHFLNATITDINTTTKEIITTKQTVEYDYLILATGIEYDYEQLFKKDKKKAQACQLKAPAGLKPGSEHFALKNMISNFTQGNFIISVPAQNYKCPPAPYERACMIAHYFKTQKIKGKVIIIDPRSKPAAKPKAFLQAFKEYYANIIEYHPNTLFKDIDFETKQLCVEVFNKTVLDFETIYFDFEQANIIPPNRANHLIKKAGLATYKQGWAKLQQPSFRSISNDSVYVIGDAQGEYPYPKSAQMANSCGYLVAQEIVNRLQNRLFDYKKNMPGNVCYSMITHNKAVSISHLFEYNHQIQTHSFISKIDQATADAAKGWYFGLIEDVLSIQNIQT